MKEIEQELKLQLNKQQYLTMLSYANGQQGKLQSNHYFYYDGMSADRMLRIRHANGCFQLTYKLRKSNVDGVMMAVEYNAEVGKDFADACINKGLPAKVVEQLLGVRLPADSRYIGCLTTLRTKYVYEGCNIELDCNHYLDQVDFELECEDLDVTKLDALRAKLEQEFGQLPNSLPKVQRFVNKLASTPAFCK